MKLRLHIWKQANSRSRGRFESHDRSDVSPDMSFLEMLDELNEELMKSWVLLKAQRAARRRRRRRS